MKEANEPEIKAHPTPGEQQFKDETARELLLLFLQLSVKQGVQAVGRSGSAVSFDYAQAAIGAYMAAEAMWLVRKGILEGHIKFQEDPKDKNTGSSGTILPV